MIKVNEWKNSDTNPKTYKISAFADTKAEVQSATFPDDYIGLPADAEAIEMESDIMTADGDFAFMKSNGQWNWI